MAIKYTNKSRKRNRLKNYNYNNDGMYFITSCAQGRIEYFGKIKNEKMEYSKYGNIILKFWQEIPNHYKNVFLDEYIIMPNHIHGIVVIDSTVNLNSNKIATKTVGTAHCAVPTVDNSKNYGLLSKIIKSFKEISLKTIRRDFNDYEFKWQRSFHDHIIRDEKSLQKIRRYIYYNPAGWEMDRNNLKSLDEI